MFKGHGQEFYGTATVGEKGQVVVPSEARKALRIVKGEKLLVFGFGPDMVVLSKLSSLKKLSEHLTEHLKGVEDVALRSVA